MLMLIDKIVSGGQTGVDRAALDVAEEYGIPRGGWCPRQRKAEDGPISESYPLQETPSDDYAQRTRRNVRDSQGTLILTVGEPTGGTALTQTTAGKMDKPCLVVDLNSNPDPRTVVEWLRTHTIKVLSLAGPRESQQPGIYRKAARFLRKFLSTIQSEF